MSAQEKEILENFRRAKEAGYRLQTLPQEEIKPVLRGFAAALREKTADILAANAEDLAKMDKNNPLYDRLLLDKARLDAIASDVGRVAELHGHVGDVLEERTLPNGARLSRVRVPLGVVGAIFEARPNVTADVFSLCFRTQNACVLKGSSDAEKSNEALVKIMHGVLRAHNLPESCVYLMPPAREHLPVMLAAYGLVDVVIPRGSQGLIDFVRENATIPVIETGRGVVHVYFDAHADAAMGQKIIFNAKTRRPSVCNSLDTLLVHQSRLADLPQLMEGLAEKSVRVQADAACLPVLEKFYPRDLLRPLKDGDCDTEFLGLGMNAVAVADVGKACAHIRAHGSGHTECIVTEDADAAQLFLADVDAAVVTHNASTAFADGGEFGLGAEIGISTQKLHARGPMGLEPLTSYKWILRGNGQVR